MHKQPIMIKKKYADPDTCHPVSEKLWNDGLYLPSSVGLKENQIQFIGDVLKKLKK